MSLLFVYHDSKRAVVASDDLAISFNDRGEPMPVTGRVSKFVVAGDFVFAVLGRSDLAANFKLIAASLVSMNPGIALPDLAHVLSKIFLDKWAARKPEPNLPPTSDALEAAIVGYDAGENRMRSFVLPSYEKFKPYEVTADRNARIFALGAYDAGDRAALERLTNKFRIERPLGNVAAVLRDSMNEFHARHPQTIGKPCFYAALGSDGVLPLSAEFPLPPSFEFAAAGAHHVTTTKQDAMAGTTRFFLGSILTPQAGGPPTIGNNDGGDVGGSSTQINFVLTSSGGVAGPLSGSSPSGASGTGASLTNPYNAVDSDKTTFAELQVTGNGNGQAVSLYLATPAQGYQKFSSVTLNILWDCPTNNITPGTIATLTMDYNQPALGGATTQILHLLNGTTQALTTTQVTIDPSSNISNFLVSIFANSGATQTGGSCIVRIYGIWLSCVA